MHFYLTLICVAFVKVAQIKSLKNKNFYLKYTNFLDILFSICHNIFRKINKEIFQTKIWFGSSAGRAVG